MSSAVLLNMPFVLLVDVLFPVLSHTFVLDMLHKPLLLLLRYYLYNLYLMRPRTRDHVVSAAHARKKLLKNALIS